MIIKNDKLTEKQKEINAMRLIEALKAKVENEWGYINEKKGCYLY